MVQTLYSMPGTCALAPHIALIWSGRPFKLKVLTRGENHEVEYVRINPLGSVPALLFPDGRVLTEAHAILAYIARDAPAVFGAPHNSLEAARLHQTLSFYTTELHAAFGPHFAPQRYHDDAAEHGNVRAMAHRRIRRLMELTDDRMGRATPSSATRNTADPYLYVICRWLALTPIRLDTLPHLAAFKAAMDADEGVQGALEAYR